ncbi:uncharacterized protein LOC135680946 [Rhopilema esculentum]|uniref:uncharacterized protein LOC135680946 n=1 Tax=Rhopilema esculentum TaxID=499914 RepID=UPI0031DAB282
MADIKSLLLQVFSIIGCQSTEEIETENELFSIQSIVRKVFDESVVDGVVTCRNTQIDEFAELQMPKVQLDEILKQRIDIVSNEALEEFHYQNEENLQAIKNKEPVKKRPRYDKNFNDLVQISSDVGLVWYSAENNEYIVPAIIFEQLQLKHAPQEKENENKIDNLANTKLSNIRGGVKKVRQHLWENLGCPTLLENPSVFTPADMQSICRKAGVPNLLNSINYLLSAPEQSKNVVEKNESRAVNILHMLMFAQSQKCSWFQHINASFLRRHGLSESGLTALWQEGLTVHPRTARVMAKVVSFSYESLLQGWIEDAVYKRSLLVFMVDDYTNIHTMHRPTTEVPLSVSQKATLLLKRYDDIPALPVDEMSNVHNPVGVDEQLLLALLKEKMPFLSMSFAEYMPDWIWKRFFDPESERNRLALHDYQEYEKIG